ncbi:unnamed protein product [Spirodela intermedia]|uniref:Uncharacterized protein n=1 Tax=Spirodela intermedia TaxID=51605 RepID=A0A7I8KE72_SPIIN|nr:unnamed protein product [Spirodela intermedia]
MPFLRVALFSAAASSAALPRGPSPPSSPLEAVSVVDYLIDSFGFSQEEAARVSRRLNRLKAPRNPESVLAFLKGKGVSEAAVREAVSRRPTLLYVDVEKTLAPKFRAFEEMGFSGTDLLRTLGRNSSFLHYSLEKKLMPNISLLQRECGISGRRIFKVLKRSSRLVGRSTSSLKDLIRRVRELGFSHGSVAFETGLHVADSLSQSSVTEKLAFLQSLGWTEEETLRAVRRYPLILGLSEKKLKDSMQFFVGKIGCDASYLAANAILLTFSIEKRVKPRYRVYQTLQLMKVPEGGWSLLSLFSVSESVFLNRFVLKYVDRHPELREAYDSAGFGTKLHVSLG